MDATLDEERDRALATRLQLDEIREQEAEQEQQRADEALAARTSSAFQRRAASEHQSSSNRRDTQADVSSVELERADHEHQEEELRASLAWHTPVDLGLAVLLLILASASREGPPKALAAVSLLAPIAGIMAVRPNTVVHLVLAHPLLAMAAVAVRCTLPAMTENFLVGSSSAILAAPALHHFGLAAQRAVLFWRRSKGREPASRSNSRARRPTASSRSRSLDSGGIALSSVT